MIFRDTLNPEESSANIPQGFDPAPPIIVETRRKGEKDRQTGRQAGSQTEGERGVGWDDNDNSNQYLIIQ